VPRLAGDYDGKRFEMFHIDQSIITSETIPVLNEKFKQRELDGASTTSVLGVVRKMDSFTPTDDSKKLVRLPSPLFIEVEMTKAFSVPELATTTGVLAVYEPAELTMPLEKTMRDLALLREGSSEATADFVFEAIEQVPW
jgi:hypothetical protein